MSHVLLQIDERGRITLPRELRKAWGLHAGDYLVVDPENKHIDRANILTDEELSDPEVIASLIKLRDTAVKDLYSQKTKSLDSYVAERKLEE